MVGKIVNIPTAMTLAATGKPWQDFSIWGPQSDKMQATLRILAQSKPWI